MNRDLNDPRLTAYALGELDPAEQAPFETLLAEWPEGREAVDGIRATAAILTRELAADARPADVLTREQRQSIEARLDGRPAKVAVLPRRRRRAWALPAALAASLVALLAAGAVYFNMNNKADEPLVVAKADFDERATTGDALLPGRPANDPHDMGLLLDTEKNWQLALQGVDGTSDPSAGNTAPSPDQSPDFRAIVGQAPPEVTELERWVVDSADKMFIGNNNTARGSVADVEGSAPLTRTSTAPPADNRPYAELYAIDSQWGEGSEGEAARKRMENYLTKKGENAPPMEPPSKEESEAARARFMKHYAQFYSSPKTIADGDGDGKIDDERLNYLVDERVANGIDLWNALDLSYPDPDDVRRVTEALGIVTEAPSTEQYAPITENDFLAVYDSPLSTFSIDVDTASYSNVRRYLSSGQLPPPDAVRIEELLNYFEYDYAPPMDDAPFAFHSATAACPWNPEHVLLRVALKGLEVENEERPAANLVFLLDVSGSMNQPNKLPLVKYGMEQLVNGLAERDRIAIVVYAGASGLVLPSTEVGDRQAILEALGRLEAGGSTNGGAGIELAYQTAVENLIEGGINRVILCTDGDFNVGISNRGSLVNLIEKKRETGIFLSVLGFGMGNYKDDTLEQLANKGNGTYGYIDTEGEVRKLLVEEMNATLMTIAKDVKIQIEFNPVEVKAYRLIGYENRVLAAQDFNDDKKDAGEIGAGHTVTALYELVPADREIQLPEVDPLRYQSETRVTNDAYTGEIATLKLRYKNPDEDTSQLLESPVHLSGAGFDQADEDFRFAASVASFGMLLRHSKYAGEWTMATVLELANNSIGEDEYGYRAEFVRLVEQAKSLLPDAAQE